MEMAVTKKTTREMLLVWNLDLKQWTSDKWDVWIEILSEIKNQKQQHLWNFQTINYLMQNPWCPTKNVSTGTRIASETSLQEIKLQLRKNMKSNIKLNRYKKHFLELAELYGSDTRVKTK